MRKFAISEICEVNPKKSEIRGLDDTISVSFIRMEDVSEDGQVTYRKSRPLSEVYKSYTYFTEGDLLFAKITPCMENGKRALASNLDNGIGFGSTEFHVLRPGDAVEVEYLKHMIGSKLFRHVAEGQMTGSAGQKRVPTSFFDSFKIPLPPLAEQQRIAAILDAADAYRQKTKALIAKYDELTQSLFLEMFGDPVTNPKGWEHQKLGTITHMKAGKFVPASEIYPENNEDHYPCYGGNGLRGYLKSFTHDGDFILVGRQGALCGNVKMAKGVFHATEHAIVCSPKEKYETLWLYHLLDIMNLNKHATGAAQPGLNVGKLVGLDIVFPPIKLQNQFAARIEAIESQKSQAQASLEKAEDLFNSLLQRAFSGELTRDKDRMDLVQ